MPESAVGSSSAGRPRQILVTGGSGGIGSAVVDAFLGRGDVVTVWDVTPPDRSDVTAIHVDVSDADDVQRAATYLPDQLDAVVTCAGVPLRAAALQTTPEQWRRLLAINLDGTFWTATACHGALAEARGTLVTLGSVAAHESFANRSAYCASKAAIVMLTRCLGNEWAVDGVRAVCVSPGFIDGGMAREGIESGGNDTTRIIDRTPGHRLVKTTEVAGAIVALTSDTFTGLTAGEVLIDLGFHSGARV